MNIPNWLRKLSKKRSKDGGGNGGVLIVNSCINSPESTPLKFPYCVGGAGGYWILEKPGWRPKDLANPYSLPPGMGGSVDGRYGVWEAGASAGIEAVIKRLNEECTDKHLPACRYNYSTGALKGYCKRKDCDTCMESFKKEIENG